MEVDESTFENTAETPGWLRKWIYETFPVDFEPQIMKDFQPLKREWEGFGFAHPPHADAASWCEKAAQEATNGNRSVLLLPAIFNSLYWKESVYPFATEIRVLSCPVKLPGKTKQIVSQMALVIYAGHSRDKDEMPPIYVVEPKDWEENYYKRSRNLKRFKRG